MPDSILNSHNQVFATISFHLLAAEMQTHPPTDTTNAGPPEEVGLDVPLAAIEAVDPGVIASKTRSPNGPIPMLLLTCCPCPFLDRVAKRDAGLVHKAPRIKLLDTHSTIRRRTPYWLTNELLPQSMFRM